MTAVRLALRGARAQAGLLAVVLVLSALTTAAVAGGVVYVSAAARDGLRSVLSAAEPDEAAARVHTRVSAEPSRQQEAAAGILDDELGDLPVVVHRSVRSMSVQATAADGAALGPVILGTDDLGADGVRIVAGSWPPQGDVGASDDVPTAVHAGAAAALGLAVGDAVEVVGEDGDRRALEVLALWEPLDPDAPEWFGDPLLAAGLDEDGGLHGPFVVQETVITGLSGLDLVRWVIVPDLTLLQPADLPALREAIDAIDDRMGGHRDVAVRGLVTSPELGETLDRVERMLGATRGVMVSALLVVVLAAAVAVSQVARLLAAVRAGQATVLRSRGASARQLSVVGAVEAVCVALPGAVLGAVGVRLAGPSSPEGLGATLAVAAAVVVAVAVLLTGAAARGSRRGDRSGSSDIARRSSTPVTGAALAGVVGAAGFAVWQLRQDPAGDTAGAGPHVDPAVVAAVPLALLATALLTAALLGPVTAVAARYAARRRDLPLVLTLRQISRNAVMHAVPVTAVALVAATLVLASAYAGTALTQRDALAQVDVGAPVRVTLRGDAAAAEYSAIDGAVAAVPARATLAVMGSDRGRLVALPATGREEVMLVPEPALDRAALLRALDGGPGQTAGITLPDGTREITLLGEIDDLGEAGAPDIAVQMWFAGQDEQLVTVQAGTVAPQPDGSGSAGYTWTVELPTDGLPAGGQGRLVAVDLVPGEPVDAVLRLQALGAEDVPLHGPGWSATLLGTDAVPLPPDAAGVRVSSPGGASTADTVRFVAGEAVPVPVVLTEQWAAAFALDRGDVTTLRVDGRAVEVQVVATTTAVPGAQDGLAALADLGALDRAMLRTGEVGPVREVWIATDRPDDVVRAAADLPATAVVGTVESVEDPVAASALLGFWLAGAASIVFGIPGAAAAVVALARARRVEVAVLHSLGLGPAQQARARRAELGWVTGTAVLLGMVGGLAVALLCVPALVRSGADVGQVVFPAPVQLHLVGGAGLLLVTVAALAGVAYAYGNQARRQARGHTWREELR